MTSRQFLIRRALLKGLLNSKPYVVLGAHLQSSLALDVPRLPPTEFDAEIAACEQDRYILSVQQDRGLSYTIRVEGEAWLLNNAA